MKNVEHRDKIQYTLLLIIFLFSCGEPSKHLHLPSLFSDGMVLQRDSTVAIWGKSLPKSEVHLLPSWGKTVSTTSDSNGSWKTILETSNGETSFSLVIKSEKEKIINLTSQYPVYSANKKAVA